MNARPTIVLLHGLARTHRSLRSLRRYLERAGFPTWARSYPSRRIPLVAVADTVADWIARDFPSGAPLAAVTHSLGGVVVRHIGERIAFKRVVMLAPPNQGSRVARALASGRVFRWFFGPVGQEIAALDGYSRWPAASANVPCAVIAGTRAHAAWNPYGWFIRRVGRFGRDEANDGMLAVDETRLPGMAAFTTVDATHTFIMNNARAREMVVRFLDGGAIGDGVRDASAGAGAGE